ncbi:MAG: hypothetical protein J6I64_08230, partial [Lachnospiraceae bacterium]|nr:hypothetical protein [Lachnospiraceae bacterium]
LEVLKNVITDPILLSQGFQIYDNYIFRAIRHPANVFDAIMVRNPSDAHNFGGRVIESIHSLSEHIAYISQYRIDKAMIIADDISFLDQCPTLKHLNIHPSDSANDNFDYSPLYNLSGILSLRCSTKYGKYHEYNTRIDYSRIHGLEDLSIGTENDMNFQCIPSLKKLSVSDYRNLDLRNLFRSKELDTLELNSCGIRTLDGIESAPKMQCLYLTNNRYLEDISRLVEVKETLTALRIRKSSRIRDFSILSQLANLEYLFLEGTNVIPTLDFIANLPNLKTMILNMEVEDGDLLPCMNLSYVHCGRIRKHYNVKAEDLPKGIYYQGNENIDLWRRVQ